MSDWSAGDWSTGDGSTTVYNPGGVTGSDAYAYNDYITNKSFWDTIGSKLGGLSGASIAGAVGGIAGLLGANNAGAQKVGYTGGIPKYAASRTATPMTYTPETYVPGQGKKYFSDVDYTLLGPLQTPTNPALATPANTPGAANMAAALTAFNAAKAASARPPSVMPGEPPPFVDTTFTSPPGGAAGGLAALKHGRYLIGDSDGMADKVPANIDGRQEAKLSHGEFVIPADIVSHLGNGNSDAGAKALYAMMDRIRKARTGTKKQGKEINPDKFLPK